MSKTTEPSATPKPDAAKARSKRLREKANTALVTFVPDTDFVDKPFGPTGGEMHFRAGVPSSPVPKAFVDGLAKKSAG